MSDEFKDEMVSDSVENTVESISENIMNSEIIEVIEEPVVTIAHEESLIASPEPEVAIAPAPFLGTTDNGAIGSMSANKKTATKKKVARNDNKAYLMSERALFINGVGRLWKGFNVVPKKYEDKWLSHSGVRMATTEEIDKEYGR